MKNSALFFAALFISSLVSAQVYKWVDENGVTHYGSVKPPTTKVEELDIENGGTKATSEDVKQFAEGAKKALAKDYGNATTLDCSAAVIHSHEQLDDMLTNLTKNFNSGYIADADYQNNKRKLETTRGKLNLDDCQASSGGKRDFYLCMANPKNSLLMCDAKSGS